MGLWFVGILLSLRFFDLVCMFVLFGNLVVAGCLTCVVAGLWVWCGW